VLSIVNDQRGAPISAQELARVTLQVLAQASLPVRQLYHMTARGETTWYGLAKEIVKELERRKRKTAKLKPVTTAEYPAAAKRPLDSVLISEKLINDFGVRLSHWNESLRVTLTELDA
jgi:dTDP-4-dehydrorhamnose reductase